MRKLSRWLTLTLIVAGLAACLGVVLATSGRSQVDPYAERRAAEAEA